MSITRGEYERQEAAAMVPICTVAEMRAAGYYSARTDEPDRGEWQTVRVPPWADRREAEEILARFSSPIDLDPKPYGSGGA